MSDFARPEALVDAAWIVEHLDDPNVRVIDVDEDTSAYEMGHIRNAVGWNWTTDLHDPLRRDYVDQDGLSRLLQQAGVGPDTTVVLYGGNNNWFAAYAYWLCRYLGFDAVKAAGRRAQTLGARRARADADGSRLPIHRFPRRGTRPGRAACAARRGARQARPGAVHRCPVAGEFRGERLAPEHLPQEQAQVPGHIPGAVNIPWSKAANDDGTFRGADELRALYGGEGIAPDRGVIAYCRIGERSAHTWFVLHELLGYPSVENYDGSWTEYGSLVGVPVER